MLNENNNPKESLGVPTNLNESKVILRSAKESGIQDVAMWGTGSPRREFLHVDDLAKACLYMVKNYDGDIPLNVGCGDDITIKELAETIARIVGFGGKISWDPSKPDGTPRKLLDISRLRALGWSPQIPLEDGVKSTYKWYQDSAL